ncbi:hypothetical protein [Orenia marismortui]|uniref:DUF3887 domain-containing protein n=1 Tax=Orenia marismortui TaxID=46469 RepID=A0A4R8H940_9FIRM|nr:hypothetical protein [Orenia marismortui]TDX51513.1 hypothetical protein C7959_11213 [Orenia marismortui]
MKKFILILLIINLIFVISCCSNRGLKEQAISAGNDLVNAAIHNESVESELIVFVGEGIKNKFRSLSDKLKKEYEIIYKRGDAPHPTGEKFNLGVNKCILTIKNQSGELLALRLKYDNKLNKFHILGFWTPK